MKFVTLAIALACAGCGITPPPAGYLPSPDQLRRTVSAPPAKVVTAAVSVLASYGMTVAVMNADAGTVTSAPLTVAGSWQSAAVKDRLYCGKLWDSGVEIAVSSPVQVTIGFVALPAAVGSDVQLIVNATATRAKPTGVAGGSETYPCQPTAAFTAELMEAIANRSR